MIDVKNWICDITQKLKAEFDKQLLFVGIQGSYGRNEANEHSDVDIVVILANLNIENLTLYKKIINSMPYKEKACGFICGQEELKNWSKYELFQLYNDTKPIYGDMKELIPTITKEDAKTAAKIGTENIYHMACHSFLHSNDTKESLKELYKAVFFVLQAKYYYENGIYISSKQELTVKLSSIEKEISQISQSKQSIDNFTQEEINNSYKKLINFCSQLLKEYK